MPAAGTIKIRPRYYRLYTDPGIVAAEENYRYAELDWEIPTNEAALVCLDVWNWHFSKDGFERMDAITREKIVPLVVACRRAGLQVIHAPASPIAQQHPNWVRLIPENDRPKPEWPPKDFREKKGCFARYASPHEPQQEARDEHRKKLRKFHPEVEPVGDEAVILSGEELHRLCAERGILHLFYVGFSTNMCIIMRNYGVLAMMLRGYGVLLVRDCTTGMETHETKDQLICTRGMLATLEQAGIHTVASGHLIGALGMEIG